MGWLNLKPTQADGLLRSLYLWPSHYFRLHVRQACRLAIFIMYGNQITECTELSSSGFPGISIELTPSLT